MKTLIDYINKYNKFNINKYNDYLLNYTYEDFLEDPKDIYGNKIETIVENNIVEYNTVYLEVLFEAYVQGNIYDNYNKYQELLYESILKSYDSKKLANVLNKKFKEYILKIDLIKTSDIVNSIRIVFNKEFDNSNKDYQSLLNLYNYYEAANKDNKIITLSPRISEDKTNEVYKTGIVYHICPKYVTENILKNGLRPKGGKNSKIYKNRAWHPKSVYVIYGDIDNNIKEYFKDEINSDKIHTEYDDKVLKSDDVDIIKINLNKYDRKLKFYQDTLGGNQFVFTREYIPPFCISLYKENPIKKFIKNLFKL